MFTGIIEEIGRIVKIESDHTNKHFHIESPISKESYIDQSISHNGVCLTVIEKNDKKHVVTAIKESLDVSNLNDLKEGNIINLERAMLPSKRMDGHIVQGHVDGLAECTEIRNAAGSWYFQFKLNEEEMNLIVEKGSVCINGVSLTVCNPTSNSFEVAIIPYTYEHTNFNALKIGSKVNIEFDIVGKYVIGYLKKLPNLK